MQAQACMHTLQHAPLCLVSTYGVFCSASATPSEMVTLHCMIPLGGQQPVGVAEVGLLSSSSASVGDVEAVAEEGPSPYPPCPAAAPSSASCCRPLELLEAAERGGGSLT